MDILSCRIALIQGRINAQLSRRGLPGVAMEAMEELEASLIFTIMIVAALLGAVAKKWLFEEPQASRKPLKARAGPSKVSDGEPCRIYNRLGLAERLSYQQVD